MTTTEQRLKLLLPVLAQFPELGPFANQTALEELLTSELGSIHALDERSVHAPTNILHILSENTPLAAMQSLIRGLLLGSGNWCKLPKSGLPRFEEMIGLLPQELGELAQYSRTLPEVWLREAEAIIVFGSDETVQMFEKMARSDQIFAGYGHRWSGAIIFSDDQPQLLEKLLQDIVLYDQLGCLSAQIIFVSELAQPSRFAEKLASAVQRYDRQNLAVNDNLAIQKWRQHYHWRAAMDNRVRVWASADSNAWTVVFDGTGAMALTPLYRSVLVVPFAEIPVIAIGESLSSLAVAPFTEHNVARCADLGASRVCAVGDLQFPHPTWQQDGFPALGRLVRAS